MITFNILNSKEDSFVILLFFCEIKTGGFEKYTDARKRGFYTDPKKS